MTLFPLIEAHEASSIAAITAAALSLDIPEVADLRCSIMEAFDALPPETEDELLIEREWRVTLVAALDLIDIILKARTSPERLGIPQLIHDAGLLLPGPPAPTADKPRAVVIDLRPYLDRMAEN